MTLFYSIYEPSELDINVPSSPSDDKYDDTEERYVEERPNIYSTAAESLTIPKKKVSPPLALTLPDITKPPLTDADLEMLTTELDAKARMEAEAREKLRKNYEERRRTYIKTSTPNRRPPGAEDEDLFDGILSGIDDRILEDDIIKDTDRRLSSDAKDKTSANKSSTQSRFSSRESTDSTRQKVYKRLADKYNPKPKSKTTTGEPPPPSISTSDKNRNAAHQNCDRIISSSNSERKTYDKNISDTSANVPSHMTLDKKIPTLLTSAYDRNVGLMSPTSDKSNSINRSSSLWSPTPSDDNLSDNYSSTSSFNPIKTSHYEVPLYDGTKSNQNKPQYKSNGYSSIDSINPFDDPRPAFPDDHMDSHYLNCENTFSYDDYRKQENMFKNPHYMMDRKPPHHHHQQQQGIEERSRDPRLCRDNSDRQNYDNRQLIPPLSLPPHQQLQQPYYNPQMQPNYPVTNLYQAPAMIPNNDNIHVQKQNVVQVPIRRADPRTSNWTDQRLTNSMRNDKQQSMPKPSAPVARPRTPLWSEPKTLNTIAKSEFKTGKEMTRENQKEKETKSISKQTEPSKQVKPKSGGKSDKKEPKSDVKTNKTKQKKNSDQKTSKNETKVKRTGSKTKDLTKSVYDKVYAKIDAGEQFTSPLESLYGADTKSSRGYGFQKFKIPKKPKPEPEVITEQYSQSNLPVAEMTECWDTEIETNKTAQVTTESWDAEIETNLTNRIEMEECWDSEIVSNIFENDETVEERNDADVDESYDINIKKKTKNLTKRRVRPLSSDEDDVDDDNNKDVSNDVINKTNDTPQTDTLTKGINDLKDGTLNKSDFIEIINSMLGAQQTKKLAKIKRILQSDESSEDDDEISTNSNKQKTEIDKNFDEAMKQLKKMRTNKKDATRGDRLKMDEQPKEEPKKEKPKQIRRSELDRLHDDIKEVMGESMHQTSIKRNCTVSRNQSNSSTSNTNDKSDSSNTKNKSDDKKVTINASDEAAENSEDTNVSLSSNDSMRKLRSSTRSLRVLIEKPDALFKKKLKKERNLKNVEDKECVNNEKIQPKRKQRQQRTKINSESESNLTDTEDDNKSTKTVKKKLTKMKKGINRTGRKSKVDLTNTDDTSEVSEFNDTSSRDDKLITTITLPTKTKIAKNKGKVKRQESAESTQINSEYLQETSNIVTTDITSKRDDSVENAKVRRAPKSIIVTPNILKELHNITYYYQPAMKMRCKLCTHKNFNLAAHYVSLHNDYEVLISRFDPETTQRAIDESIAWNLNAEEPYEMLINNKRKHFSFSCRFCSLNYHKEFTENFYNHLTSHTGEFRNRCDHCSYASSNLKNLKLHVTHKHRTKAPETEPPPLNYKYVFGYLCTECNYVQLHKENTEKHVKSFHSETNPEIIKISMSSFKETVLETDDLLSSESIDNVSAVSPLQKNVFTCETDINFDEENNLDEKRPNVKTMKINETVRPRTSIAEVLKTKLNNSIIEENEEKQKRENDEKWKDEVKREEETVVLVKEDDDDFDTPEMDIDETCTTNFSKIITSELNDANVENTQQFNNIVKAEDMERGLCVNEEKGTTDVNPHCQSVINCPKSLSSVYPPPSSSTVTSTTNLSTDVTSVVVKDTNSSTTGIVVKQEIVPLKKINKLLRTESIVIHVKQDNIIYTCLMPNCDYFCEESNNFEEHCKTHNESVPLICNICNLKYEHEGSNVNVLDLFNHLKFTHLDVKPEIDATPPSTTTQNVNSNVPLLIPKQEVTSSIDDSNNSNAPLFTKSEHFPISFQLTSVESQVRIIN